MRTKHAAGTLLGCLVSGTGFVFLAVAGIAITFGRMFQGCEFDFGPHLPKTVAALDTGTGEQQWSRRFRGRGFVQVGGTARGRVILGDPRGGIRGLELIDGSDAWRVEPLGGAASVPLVVEDRVFVLGCDRALYAYDARTGRHLWRTGAAVRGEGFWELSGLGERALRVSVVQAQAVIVTAGAGDRALRGFDATTGQRIWEVPLYGGVRDMPVPAEGIVLVTDDTGTTYAFDVHTGTLRWTRPDDRAADYLSTELVAAGALVGIPDINTDGGSNELIFVDAASGAERWRMSAPNLGPFGHPIFASDPQAGRLYEGEGDTIVRDVSTGSPLRTLSRAGAGAILVAGNSLVVEQDGVRAFDPTTGERLWSVYEDWDESTPSAYADGVVIVTLGERLDD